MTNETLNATLYKKMFTEQKKYRQWLLTQPAEEILRHSYEYNIRQDILCTLEYNDLTDNQVIALIKSPTPLADVFYAWEHRESGYMNEIWNTVECHSNEVIKQSIKKSRNAER